MCGMSDSFINGIDLDNETAIVLMAARSLFTFKPCKMTLYKWSTKGVQNQWGDHVVLETFREGGYRMTTVEAVHRFRQALNS